jgi:hypothetical protein
MQSEAYINLKSSATKTQRHKVSQSLSFTDVLEVIKYSKLGEP